MVIEPVTKLTTPHTGGYVLVSAAMLMSGFVVLTSRLLGGLLSVTNGSQTLGTRLKCFHRSGWDCSGRMRKKPVTYRRIAYTNDGTIRFRMNGMDKLVIQ